MIYLTSDLHLGHGNILRLNDRPWETIEEMDDALIANINALVSPYDTLYMLGDLTMQGTATKMRRYRARINCKYIHFVIGNHDKRIAESGQESPFMKERDYMEIKHNGRRICMSHYPYLSWNGMHRGSLMLHGHIHSDGTYNLENCENGILRYDVGVDANDYRPVAIDDIFTFFGIPVD